MADVKTNNVTLAYAIEESLSTLPASPEWRLLEPNAIGQFGATITTVARTPISRNRQRRKGTITDLDSGVDWEADLTLSHFKDFVEGFTFATGVNSDMNIPSTAVDGTNDEYDVAALTSDQADKLEFSVGQYATLVYARGFTNATNNGIKVLDSDIAAAATAISVAETLVEEATPPTNATVELCGLRSLAAAADLTWDWNAGTKTATLTSAADITDFTQFGMSPGQFVHIGSPDSSGNVVNAFENVTANDVFGYARIRTIGTNTIVFDKTDTTLQFDDLTAPTTAVDILFGQFVRNVPTNSAEFIERSFNFELEYPNLNNPSGSRYAYSVGNYCNTMAINVPLTDKATISFGFVGTDTVPPAVARATNADTPIEPSQTGAYNTTADCVRLRITELDEDALTTDFKNLTITFNNNVSPEKVLCNLGARFMNFGNFEVDIEAQLVFTDAAVPQAVRDNTSLTMDFGLKNDDGAILFDIPSLTLGGGDVEFPVNETVLINTTSEAFQDPTLDISIGVSIFPVVP